LSTILRAFTEAIRRDPGSGVVNRLNRILGREQNMHAKLTPNLKHLLHVAAVAIVSVTGSLVLMGQQTVSREQYKVINVNAGQNMAIFERELNDLANSGWKVRSSIGNWVILVAEGP
jgi:hypothetical protein